MYLRRFAPHFALAPLLLPAGATALGEPASPRLEGSSGLRTGHTEKSGGLKRSGLADTQVESARGGRSGRTKGGKTEPGRVLQTGTLKAAALRATSLKLARKGAGTKQLETAATRVPPSQLGTLFFRVGQELEKLEGGLSETSVGYYMAALTEPEGPHHAAAKSRIIEMIGSPETTPEQASRLFRGGLTKFNELCESDAGIPREGIAKAKATLRGLRRR